MFVKILTEMFDKNYVLYNFFQAIVNFIGGIILAGIGYFAEIRGSFHLMWIALVIYFGVGLAKSKIVNKESFKMWKFLMWLLFVFVSTALVSLIYATELQLGNSSPVSYLGFMVIIIGAVLTSITRNAEKITGKYLFTNILDMIVKGVKRITGVDLNKYDK